MTVCFIGPGARPANQSAGRRASATAAIRALRKRPARQHKPNAPVPGLGLHVIGAFPPAKRIMPQQTLTPASCYKILSLDENFPEEPGFRSFIVPTPLQRDKIHPRRQVEITYDQLFLTAPANRPLCVPNLFCGAPPATGSRREPASPKLLASDAAGWSNRTGINFMKSQTQSPLLGKWRRAVVVAGLVLLAVPVAGADLKLMTLDPGHFHAALFQRERLPGIASEAYVYAPLGPDLTAHLQRVARFNLRAEHPTDWRLHIYTGPDFRERLLQEHPGQIVILSGRNRTKIDAIQQCVRAGLHVLADKPWIIEARDLPRLEAALDTADAQHVIGFDGMTERFEITTILARALVTDPAIFGGPQTGTPDDPAVVFESLHYLLKEVGGVPNQRPPWFFDVAEVGEGLTDVGTHLVDIVQWVMFPDEAIHYRTDIEVLRGQRWPTILTLPEFQKVTGEKEFPASLHPALKAGRLEYYCNNRVDYHLRGVHIRLEPIWDFVAPPGKQDTDRLVFRGRRARVEVRQGAEEQYRREVYVIPNTAADQAAVRAALQRRVAALQGDCPGVAVAEEANRLRIIIPAALRISHEEHFALLARRFLEYVRHPDTLPAWEKPNMLAKYYVTTRGVELARATATAP